MSAPRCAAINDDYCVLMTARTQLSDSHQDIAFMVQVLADYRLSHRSILLPNTYLVNTFSLDKIYHLRYRLPISQIEGGDMQEPIDSSGELMKDRRYGTGLREQSDRRIKSNLRVL